MDGIPTLPRLVYKFPKLYREEIRMLLDLKDPDLRKTRFFQEVYAEGREEGREEGRRGEAMGLVLRQLRRRLGPLSADSEGRIAALTLVQIDALGEALLDFETAGDLGDWLRRQG